MKKDYSIFLISKRPERYAKIQESLLPELLYYFDGSNAESFSQLVNRCVEASPTEIVILLSDKAYPKAAHIHKTVELLNKGYGFVGLYRFGFFGFKKELLRRIGMFDERFVGGGWEDQDFVNRLVVSNFAAYITEEVEYVIEPSSWSQDRVKDYYMLKWKHHWDQGPIKFIPILEKKLTEEKYNYDLGPSVPTKFLTCHEHSYIEGPNANHYIAPVFMTKVISSVPLEFYNT